MLGPQMAMENAELITIRKVAKWKTARVVALPMFWIKSLRTVYGRDPEYVLLKISGSRIILEPIYDRESIQKIITKEGGVVRSE